MKNIEDKAGKKPAKDTVSDAKLQKGKTVTGETPDKIDINPVIDDGLGKRPVAEAKDSTAVMAFGRYNPPTIGHEKLINKVKDVANEHGGQAHIVASHSEGTSKDPLPQHKKIGYLKKVAGEDVHVSGSSKEHPSIFHAAAKLHAAGHKHLVVVAGSDRVDEYEKKLKAYNNVEGKHGHYNFKSIKVVSAGHRDPDAEGAEGMSGTKMREHAREGNKAKFKSGLPKSLHPHADEIIKHVQSVKETTEDIFERVVNLMQRRQRALLMKRINPRLSRARNIAKQKLATDTTLKRRAEKRAKNVLRIRFAGKRGASYQHMSTSDKIGVDKMIDSKTKFIKRMALRLMPKVKQAEQQRLVRVRTHHGKPPGMKSFMAFSHEPTHGETLREMSQMVGYVEKVYDALINKLSQQEVNSLQKKADQYDVPFNIVAEVYTRGINAWKETADINYTPQQAAFNRVNSFVSGGDSFLTLDRDLAEEVSKTAKRLSDLPKEDPQHTHLVTLHMHDPLNPGVQARIVKELKVQAESDENASERARQYYESKGFKKMTVQAIKPIKQKRQRVDVKEFFERVTNIDEDASSHEQQAAKLRQKGKHMLANLHMKAAAAFKRGDKTSAQAITRDIKQKRDITESFEIAKPTGLGTVLTAADLGIKVQGGFAHHPTVLEQMKEKDPTRYARERDLGSKVSGDKTKFSQILSRLSNLDDIEKLNQKDRDLMAKMYDRLADILSSDPTLLTQVQKKLAKKK